MHYDLFNGDADGIFSLHQYRLENPLPDAQLITGVKRDICLLAQIENVTNSHILVFDISLASNQPSLLKVLHNNNSVRYFDHHFAGDIPDNPLLETHIIPSPDTCTSTIVNDIMGGKNSPWAICGAFGDNLHPLARNIAESLNLSKKQTTQLHELGELFNYNGYGATLDDLHFDPKDLYKAIQPYKDPFEFIANARQLTTLSNGYTEDLELAMQQREMNTLGKNRVYLFPDVPWARRVSGVFSNLKAREKQDLAHAIITENKDRTLMISVRAPLNNKRNADALCKLFPTGGGRAGAAGINNLPTEMLDDFLSKFHATYT